MKPSPSLSPLLCFSLLVTRALINQPFSWESSAKPNLTGDQSAETGVSLNHDGTDGSDGTGIQSVSPVPSASVATPSLSNSHSN